MSQVVTRADSYVSLGMGRPCRFLLRLAEGSSAASLVSTPSRPRTPTEMGRRFDKKGKARRKDARESDAALRVGYLWAASHALAVRAPAVSASYVRVIRQVGRRVTLGLDALSVKRWACKRCASLLLPGAGARVRIAPRRERHVVVSCGTCGAVRRYMARPVRDVPPAVIGDGAEAEVGLGAEEAAGKVAGKRVKGGSGEKTGRRGKRSNSGGGKGASNPSENAS